MLSADYYAYWSRSGPDHLADYAAGRTSWVVGLAPELAVALPLHDVLDVLSRRLGGEVITACRQPDYTHPSPVAAEPDGEWLKRTNVVGVNVRTLGSFWKVVAYALTLPDHVGGVHLLPVWEPGVVGSLYGMASWQLNPEFFSEELYRAFPDLDRVEKQLVFTVNCLHALGKAVGMDVIPHTDRYSEMVLANPACFEWVRRQDLDIVSHREHLHEEAAASILEWLRRRGPAEPAYGVVGDFARLPEADRLRLLFGRPEHYGERRDRRIDLVDWLYHRGLEPVPATMAPPYRGLEVDPDPAARTVDEAGRVWRDYRITEPTTMSRAFGPLTRYKLYGRRDDNRDWAIDFNRPRPAVWDYLTDHYAAQQARYNFDFMRGDMSHVQMRPGGVPTPEELPEDGPHGNYYDPLLAVKLRVQRTTPHFAYFAESFLAPDDFMAYGSELAHLERSRAEVTLGNLQSTVPGTKDFWEMVADYLRVAQSASVVPAWTVITGDKDDPRFDHFHHHGETARLFTGLFLGLQPLYYSLGYEQRDRHFGRAPNEVYSKLYVFQERRGGKAVSGPFRWGSNLDLFGKWTDLNRFAEGLLPHLGATELLLNEVRPPLPQTLGGELGQALTAARGDRALSWLRPATDGEGAYLFVVAFAVEPLRTRITLPAGFTTADLLFATDGHGHELLTAEKSSLTVADLAGGRCYRLT